MDELEMIGQCQKGNLQTFGLLYDKYAKRIFEFIYYKTFHKETAEDLTSNVFLKALENIRKFSADKGTFSAWLYTIARHAVIDHYRTKKNLVDIEDVWDLGVEGDLDADIDSRDLIKKVKSYLAGLDSKQREIITMRLWQEMAYEEIAAVVGKSPESCRMSFSRAMARLRKDLPAMILLLGIMLRNRI